MSKNNLCVECNKNQIYIKKRKLCGSCYMKLYRLDLLQPIPKNIRDKHTLKKLIKKYGKKILKDFETLKSNYGWTLERLAQKHGFTREYARQLYEIIFNEKYTKKVEHFKDIRACDVDVCPNDPRYKYAEWKRGNNNVWKSAKTEKMFFDECKKRKLKPKLLCDRAVDIKINGYFVDVKSCFSLHTFGNGNITPYRVFNFSQKQRKKCDFFACWHDGEKSFFIIPKKEIKTNLSNRIQISEVKTDHYSSKNRYWEYKNAWCLLKHPTA